MRPGLKVKLKRIELEKTTIAVAEEVGISREYLRLIEAGKAKNPSIDVMRRLSKVLKSTPQELFFDEK